MHINIDSLVSAATGWDCTIEVNGSTWRVRPLTLGEILSLPEAARRPDTLVQTVRGLFVSPPPIEGWTVSQLAAVVSAVGAYVGEYSSKNSGASGAAVATEVRRLGAIGRGATERGSTGPGGGASS